ncbi:GTP-binding protein EngB [Seminavis robusta]|uniref:GTP-binding protein EngB n=1 Tax=Seminavis robusta TaxID=568900 RepID=A0A9N8DAG1_9STRA|nr:GTP-binding protein EngB [Seminavis robusta]|eukprot:Sro59_g034370.1 GTP-binding protein EngB (573) ;mRNA; r:127079-128993
MKVCWALLALLSATHGFVPSSTHNKPSVPSPLVLNVNVATNFILQEFERGEFFFPNAMSSDENNGREKAPRLSRPQRKALERAQKQQKQQKVQQKKKNAKHFKLHSQAVSSLTSQSTADDVLRAIKRAQNLHDAEDLQTIEKFLLEEVDETFAFGYRGSLLSRLAVAALHMNNHELARTAIDVRRVECRASMAPMESAAIIRGLLRVHNVTDALEVLADELSLPLEGTPLSDSANQERLKWRALALSSMASRHFFQGEPSLSVLACEKLAELGPMVRESGLTAKELDMPWSRLILGASQCESGRREGTKQEETIEVDLPCNLVYSVLNAMSTFPSDNSDEVYERVSNALVRRVVFLTGAIDMKGCPAADRGEAAFIGRSNVGKSSLINMVTNRKSLAYTSKRPGKTQQFNFFAVNDKPGREKEVKYGDVMPGSMDPDSFLITDLPGFGFAKVPEKQRKQWADFMSQYLAERNNLRVVFHLIDSRHGPTDEDKKIMNQVSENLPARVNYVVVLTKADKNIKGAPGKVSKDVMQSLRTAMNENGVGKRPVILSSSNTKLGRDDLWRYLRLAAEA